jgi:hypothetical protein
MAARDERRGWRSPLRREGAAGDDTSKGRCLAGLAGHGRPRQAYVLSPPGLVGSSAKEKVHSTTLIYRWCSDFNSHLEKQAFTTH